MEQRGGQGSSIGTPSDYVRDILILIIIFSDDNKTIEEEDVHDDDDDVGKKWEALDVDRLHHRHHHRRHRRRPLAVVGRKRPQEARDGIVRRERDEAHVSVIFGEDEKQMR